MQKLQFKRTPLAFAAFLAISVNTQAQTVVANAVPESAAIPTVIIRASADASTAGLSSAYAGGQVARGGRLGLLGNVAVMDAPFNSTNYTQALIEDQQAQSVADVLQNDPAVRLTRGFGNYQEMYVIRGFTLNSDDLAYNGLFGLLPRQFVATELLERVEVFRGANTFINGATPGGGGVGGAINLLPKRAANEALTQVTVGVESGGQAYAASDIGRRFGPDNSLGVRINAARRIGATSVDAEQRALSVLAVGVDYTGRGVRLSADAGYQNHKLTDAGPSLQVNSGVAVPEAPNGARNFGQKWTYSNERDTFGNARAEVDLAQDVIGWAALGARSGVEANTLGVATLSNSNGDAAIYRFDNARKDTVRTGEIGVRGKVQTGAVSHSVSATAASYWQDSRNAYAYSFGAATNIYRPVESAMPATLACSSAYPCGNLSNPLTTTKSILSSYALADTMAFVNDSVLLTVGLRHQTIDTSGYNYDTGARKDQYKQSALTPMAGVVYKPIRNVSLYANYIEALQQGSVAAGSVSNVGEIFAPYKSKQKEIGVKYDAGTVGMSAALFSVAQPSAYVQNNVYGVYGEQRNRGLELSFYGAPVRALRVLGGLTLLEAKQMSTLGGANNGKDALAAPNTQANLGLEWDVAGVAGLTLTGRTVYTAQQ